MGDFKIISNTDDWIEVELIQPNNLLGDTSFWTDEDWTKWKEKMDRLEKEGTVGETETIRIKLKKNPFLDGNDFTK